MVYCKIGNTDVSYLVQSMKVDMEVILSDKSGRNAQADNVVDIVARKDKVEIVPKYDVSILENKNSDDHKYTYKILTSHDPLDCIICD